MSRLANAFSTNRMRGALALMDQMVCSATTLITFIVLARSSPSDDVGVYALALSLVLPLRVLQDRVIATPYMMRLRENAGRAAIILGSTLIHQTALTFVSIGLATTTATAILLFSGSLPLAQAVAVLAFVAPSILWRDLLRSISFAHLDSFAALKTDTIVLVTQLGLLAVCYSLSRVSVNSVLLLTGISSFIGCVAWQWIERRPYQLIPREAVIDWVANWKISRWLVAARVFGSAGTIFVPWVVAYGQGTAAAGLLAAGTNLVGISFMFSRGLNNYFRPKAIEAFYTGGGPLLRKSLSQMAVGFTAYMLCITALFTVAGGFLMVQFYGAAFHGAGGLVVALSLVSLATSLSMVGDNGVTALSRPDLAFWAELANGAVTIGLSVLLIGPFSLPGVAAAMLMGQITGAAILAFSVVRLTRMIRAGSVESRSDLCIATAEL